MARPPIVLIDDDRSWGQATADLLRDEGFEVLRAEDGEQGLDLLGQTQPLLVILDVNLPRLSGLEILREMRRHGPPLPVIMISADDRSSLIAQAMDQGASSFLRKPIPAGLLLRAIRQFTGTAPADRHTPTAVE